MTTDKLYIAIESAFANDRFNLNGVWDRISYTAKILMCDRMIKSESWRNLPDTVLEKIEGGDELVFA